MTGISAHLGQQELLRLVGDFTHQQTTGGLKKGVSGAVACHYSKGKDTFHGRLPDAIGSTICQVVNAHFAEFGMLCLAGNTLRLALHNETAQFCALVSRLFSRLISNLISRLIACLIYVLISRRDSDNSRFICFLIGWLDFPLALSLDFLLDFLLGFSLDFG